MKILLSKEEGSQYKALFVKYAIKNESTNNKVSGPKFNSIQLSINYFLINITILNH